MIYDTVQRTDTQALKPWHSQQTKLIFLMPKHFPRRKTIVTAHKTKWCGSVDSFLKKTNEFDISTNDLFVVSFRSVPSSVRIAILAQFRFSGECDIRQCHGLKSKWNSQWWVSVFGVCLKIFIKINAPLYMNMLFICFYRSSFKANGALCRHGKYSSLCEWAICNHAQFCHSDIWCQRLGCCFFLLYYFHCFPFSCLPACLSRALCEKSDASIFWCECLLGLQTEYEPFCIYSLHTMVQNIPPSI